MLNPFKIRDLHGPSSLGQEGARNSHGVVQISASDYDNIATSHPRARLTYPDDDDGDQITVGSSLELSQRLDEPLDIQPRLDAIQLSEDDRAPMHIFDIRRSNSVTELWKQFEHHSPTTTPQLSSFENNISVAEPAANTPGRGDSPPANVTATAAPGDVSQPPLLAAFEAELANILDSAEEPAERAPQSEPSPAAEPSRHPNSQGLPDVAEALASQIMHNLVNGASMVQSELRARLPELQRQVREAQRHLPANIGQTLQTLLANLEAHMRAAFNNLPDNGRQWADNGRQWAEEAFQAGRPMAENAAENFRSMATEVNEVGRSFLATFEQELARATSQINMASGGPNPSPATFPHPAGNTSPPTNTPNTEPQSVPSAPGLHGNQATGHDQSQHAEYGALNYAHPCPPMAWASPNWTYSTPSESLHSGFLNREFSSTTNADHVRSNIGKQSIPPPPPPPQPSAFPWWPSVASCNAFFPPLSRPQNSSIPFNQNVPQAQNIDATSGHSASADTSANPETENPGRATLFVGNVGFKVTERTIQDVFASKGFIVDVDLPLDVNTGKHAGFGYLHFPSVYPAIAAMDALQGAHIDGHAINLEYSDAVPIDSVGSHTMTGNEEFPSSQPGAQEKVKGPSDNATSMKRRKSVTFKDPPLTSNSPVPSDRPSIETATAYSANTVSSAPLIDLSIDESAKPPHDPFSPSSEPWSREVSHDSDSASLDPEFQLRRFPPVSQIEAQVLANQRQQDIPRPVHVQKPIAANEIGDATPLQSSRLQPEPTWRFMPQPSNLTQQNPPHRSQTVSHTRGDDNDNEEGAGPTLRRANTTFQAGPLNFQNPPGIRRRASEREPRRRRTPVESEDAWARLDRRTRKRSNSRRSSQHSIPGSFPAEEPPNYHSTSSDAELEKCVWSLIDMGYGTAEEGGPARMAVYAAASNNDLMEAIEMIEEERKAYERHR